MTVDKLGKQPKSTVDNVYKVCTVLLIKQTDFAILLQFRMSILTRRNNVSARVIRWQRDYVYNGLLSNVVCGIW